MAEENHSTTDGGFEARLDARFTALEEFIHERYRRADAKLDRVLGDLADIKGRLSSLEEKVVGVRRDIAAMDEAVVRQTIRIDRIDARLDRIEKRLDLREAAAPGKAP
jgi:uncharacterized coiled-coil protein SlyX